MRIQLISRNNGLGLTKDAQVLRSTLEALGHEVHFTDWQQPRRGMSYGANIFMELMNPAFFSQARVNYYLPNPEWTTPNFERSARKVDLVLCKSRDCERVFAAKGFPTRFIGFTSPDMMDETVKRSTSLTHIAGGSSAKGTPAVMEAMRRMPDLSLELVSRNKHGHPDNVTAHTGHIEEASVREIMNRNRIHLCPSSYEGFGHYINEARSVGAVVITTAASPMDELARPDFSFGASWSYAAPQNLGLHHHVEVGSLCEMIRKAMGLPTKTLDSIGKKARAAYLTGRAEFEANIAELFPA